MLCLCFSVSTYTVQGNTNTIHWTGFSCPGPYLPTSDQFCSACSWPWGFAFASCIRFFTVWMDKQSPGSQKVEVQCKLSLHSEEWNQSMVHVYFRAFAGRNDFTGKQLQKRWPFTDASKQAEESSRMLLRACTSFTVCGKSSWAASDQPRQEGLPGTRGNEPLVTALFCKPSAIFGNLETRRDPSTASLLQSSHCFACRCVTLPASASELLTQYTHCLRLQRSRARETRVVSCFVLDRSQPHTANDSIRTDLDWDRARYLKSSVRRSKPQEKKFEIGQSLHGDGTQGTSLPRDLGAIWSQASLAVCWRCSLRPATGSAVRKTCVLAVCLLPCSRLGDSESLDRLEEAPFRGWGEWCGSWEQWRGHAFGFTVKTLVCERGDERQGQDRWGQGKVQARMAGEHSTEKGQHLSSLQQTHQRTPGKSDGVDVSLRVLKRREEGVFRSSGQCRVVALPCALFRSATCTFQLKIESVARKSLHTRVHSRFFHPLNVRLFVRAVFFNRSPGSKKSL